MESLFESHPGYFLFFPDFLPTYTTDYVGNELDRLKAANILIGEYEGDEIDAEGIMQLQKLALLLFRIYMLT